MPGCVHDPKEPDSTLLATGEESTNSDNQTIELWECMYCGEKIWLPI